MNNYRTATYMLLLFACFACNSSNRKTSTETKAVVKAPEFDADSAYQYVKAQVDFGPRVPNSKEHIACGEYIANKLTEHGAEVINQYADLTAYDGTSVKARNIIGSYKPESKKRVMLCAHWDTRPWADNDEDKTNHHTPVLGANDGASGVGVLLEIARQINQQQPEVGIDIIFFDAEDMGTPQFHKGPNHENTWCLGSQYWSRNPHVRNYNPRYGILLDMVGGKDATFYREKYSVDYAKPIVDNVWNQAHSSGYGAYFVKEDAGYVTDDHLYVNRIARIPCIDIIPYDESNKHSSFGSTWHTVNDTMDAIDKSTLKAVGQTVMNVIYNE